MPVNSTLRKLLYTPQKKQSQQTGYLFKSHSQPKRSEMSIKRDIDVKYCDILPVKAKETSDQLITFNSYMDDVKAEVCNAHQELHAEHKVITAKAVKLRYMGEDEEPMTLLELVKYLL